MSGALKALSTRFDGPDDAIGVDPSGVDGVSLRALAEAMDDPVIVFECVRDATGDVVDLAVDDVNHAAEVTIGVTAEALRGKRLLELSPEHAEMGLFAQYRAVAESGAATSVTIPWIDISSRPGVFHARVAPMPDDRLVVVVRNDTELVERERSARIAAEQAERRLSTVLDSVRDAVVIIGPDRRCSFANAAAHVLLGRSQGGGAPATALPDWIHPDDLADVVARLDAEVLGIADHEPPGGFHARVVDRTGAIVPVAITVEDLSADPGVGGVVMTMRDLTAELAAASQLEQSERRHQQLMEIIPDVVVVIENGRFTFGNAAAARLCGLASPEDLIGLRVSTFQSPEVRDAAMAYGRRFLDTGTHDGPFVAWMHRLDGTAAKVEATPAPVPGNERALLMVLRDVTEREHMLGELAANARWMRTLVDGTPVGIFELDRAGDCTFVNAQYCDILGVESIDDVRGSKWIEMLHPDDAEAATARWLDEIVRRRPFSLTVRFIRPDGSVAATEVGIAPVLDDDRVTGWLGTVDDITERIELEKAHRESAELFTTAFEHAPTGMVIVSAEESPRILQANAEQLRMVGMTMEEYVKIDLVDHIHPDDAEESARGRLALIAGEIDNHHMELRQRFDPEQPWRWVSVTRSVVHDEYGNTSMIVAQVSDVTERKAEEQRQYELAVTDPLTGLANRRHFEDRLMTALERLQRSELRMGVVYIDLDHFKSVNDRGGHELGDQLLIDVAAVISEAVRPGDTVARLGGDEFAILAEHERVEDLYRMAERLRSAIEVPCVLPDGETMIVTASIGVASRHAREAEPRELVRLADQAMYDAKRQGRHRWATATTS